MGTKTDWNKYAAEDIAYHLFGLEDTTWVQSPADMEKAILEFLNKRDAEDSDE